ncbi:transcriptional repressor LexA [candidate division KSB1 bacterium]|nr:transcriptional repressor LexA [candidate division KSB1 bacterium]
MKNTLTQTQKNVLKGITQFIKERGYPPTIREIMELFGYSSVNNVQRILSVLEKKGFIRRNYRGSARCIEVIKDHREHKLSNAQLPILGTIAAGSPILAEENIEGYVTLDLSMIGRTGDFVLRVKGDSMRDANIFNDDLIIVNKTYTPKNNDIIVALLDEEATVKRFIEEDNAIKLQPENPDYSSIIIDKNDLYFKILGKVEAVIHRL